MKRDNFSGLWDKRLHVELTKKLVRGPVPGEAKWCLSTHELPSDDEKFIIKPPAAPQKPPLPPLVVTAYTNNTVSLSNRGLIRKRTVMAMNAGCKSAQSSGSDSADYQLFMSGWGVQRMVGRCRLPFSKPVLKAPLVSALETIKT
jgi:hypothetical protein